MAKTLTRKKKFSKGEKRHLTALIRRFGLSGAIRVYEAEGGKVSLGTLHKLKAKANIALRPGRPTLAAQARQQQREANFVQAI
jgi:hypothetical protein